MSNCTMVTHCSSLQFQSMFYEGNLYFETGKIIITAFVNILQEMKAVTKYN